MNRPSWPLMRRVLVVAIVVFLAPTAAAGVGQVLAGQPLADTGPDGPSVENLTIITAQGGSPEAVTSPGGIEIVNTTSKERVWSHSRPDCMRYYDAEPVDNSTLMMTVNCDVESGDRLRLAIEHNWRTNTTERVMRIPWDAHDVDRLGPHRYAVADIADQQAYVYNYTAGENVTQRFDGLAIRDSWRGEHDWEWDFTEHYPESAGGEEGYDEDYTHLNDVDSIYNDSAFLLSPRDFDRVMAVNRSTKEVMWTLGEQDNFGWLHGQHHPTLIETDPATLVLGDSNNHRVAEYRRDEDGEWGLSWWYNQGLNWPRSVDRLPSGNTLITDTGNDRVIEVAPNKSIVWEYETMANPYEADRYAHGNEPRGPTMERVVGQDNAERESGVGVQGGVTLLEEYHRIAGFVLPGWIGKWAFLGLALATVSVVVVLVVEAGRTIRRRV